MNWLERIFQRMDQKQEDRMKRNEQLAKLTVFKKEELIDTGEAKIIKEASDGEYEIVERIISPAKIVCPDCGGITLEGLDYCDQCGGELNQNSSGIS